jgi:hypothetical protein
MEKGKVVDAEQILAENIKYEAKHAPTVSAQPAVPPAASVTEDEVAADMSLVEAPIEATTEPLAEELDREEK